MRSVHYIHKTERALPMDRPTSFDERVTAALDQLSPAERRVTDFFRANREEVLVASAASLAEKIGTSDATVVRTTKGLGYSGLDELRKNLAGELRERLAPARRIERTLSKVGDDLEAAFRLAIETQQAALDRLRHEIKPADFKSAVTSLTSAKRVFVFGIGPSSAMAQYFVIQMMRFGMDAVALTHTGLLLADGLNRLRSDDVLVILAYSNVYREVEAMLDHARDLEIQTILLTDTLASALYDRVDLVLPVARGRADMFSMHTATLGLIEALLVGIASNRRDEVISSLNSLNQLRENLVGRRVDIAPSTLERRAGQRRTSRKLPSRRGER